MLLLRPNLGLGMRQRSAYPLVHARRANIQDPSVRLERVLRTSILVYEREITVSWYLVLTNCPVVALRSAFQVSSHRVAWFNRHCQSML